jgi:hypothetical protein
MPNKRKTKKKAAKKEKAAPKPVPVKPGVARKIEGLEFWKYKAQLLEDRSIGLRAEIIELQQGAAEYRGKTATLTKLISDLEQQLADKEAVIVGYEKRFLEADRANVQRGNAALVAELQIDTNTHDAQIIGDSLVLRLKPKEARKK